MWNLTKIPKVVHFYWGKENLSYLRFLSIKSFRHLNPDWKIKIHTTKVQGVTEPTWVENLQSTIIIDNNFFDSLFDLNVEIIEHDFSIDFDNNAHDVHKSDFLRWKLLSAEGGVWSDFDIIYKSPMTSLIENIESNSDVDTFLCPYKNLNFTQAIGFLMSSENNKYFKFIFEQAKIKFNKLNYESIGIKLMSTEDFKSIESLNKLFPGNNIIFLDQKCVYSIMYRKINDFFCPMRPDLDLKLKDDNIIGFHWYGGHPVSKKFEESLTPENISNFNNILTNSILKIKRTH